MDSQLNLVLPIPIIEEIISFSSSCVKLTFRVTCKRFWRFTCEQFFPTFTTTVCGSGIIGHKDGNFNHAEFNIPCFGVLNASSTILFISDSCNFGIRKIELCTGQVTTLCGSSTNVGWKDEIGDKAHFRSPLGLALSEKENLLYVSDSWNHVIRSTDLITGRVTTIVGNPHMFGKKDGICSEATFNVPVGLALDSVSNFLYVADRENHSIRKIFLKERRVETLCGNGKKGHVDGSFEESQFFCPSDIVLNSETQELYVSDYWNRVIRSISLKNKTVKTLCGTPGVSGYENGGATQTKFNYLSGLGLDSLSHYLYATDENHVVRRISLLGEVKVDILCGTPKVAGDRDGFFPAFFHPKGIVVDPHSQSVYMIDRGNHKVKKIMDRKRVFLNDEIVFSKNTS